MATRVAASVAPSADAALHAREADDASTDDSAAGERLRVAAVIDAYEVSGPGRQLAAVAGALREIGVDLTIFMFARRGRPRPPLAAYLERAGVRTTLLDDAGPLDVGVVGRLARALGDFAPHVVQTHGYRPSALASLLRLRGARWPWIAFFHGATAENLKVRLYHWLDRRLMTGADRLVVMSQAHLGAFRHVGERAVVVHNAVVVLPDAASAGGARELDGVPSRDDGTTVLGVVGRLSHEKGVDVFLDACALLVSRGVEFRAVVAVDGPERAALEAARGRLGLESRVRFVGAVKAVDALYDKLSMLVIPSRSEGLPNVLLEALRKDLPVAATTVGAIPEVIDSPLAGALCDPGSAPQLADAIERALALRESTDAHAARRRVVARFSLQARARAHMRLYESVLGERAGRRA